MTIPPVPTPVPDITDMACPQPQNMAAVALQMQKTALDAEARIYVMERALRAALNRPTWILRSTVQVTGLAANIDADMLNGASLVEDFNNTAFAALASNGAGNLPYDGLWQIGLSANVIASGAINDNTHRTFIVQHIRPNSASTTGFAEIWREDLTLMESNTAVGADGCVIVEVPAVAGDSFRCLMNHGNTSSTLNVPSGTFLWATLISSADSVKVM